MRYINHENVKKVLNKTTISKTKKLIEKTNDINKIFDELDRVTSINQDFKELFSEKNELKIKVPKSMATNDYVTIEIMDKKVVAELGEYFKNREKELVNKLKELL